MPGLFDAGNWRTLVGVLYPPTELWDAIKDNWQEAAVIAAYASVPLVVLYGLHGFRRRRSTSSASGGGLSDATATTETSQREEKTVPLYLSRFS